jgi:hypothetical protein
MIRRYSVCLSPFAFITIITVPFLAGDMKALVGISSLALLYFTKQIKIEINDEQN